VEYLVRETGQYGLSGPIGQLRQIKGFSDIVARFIKMPADCHGFFLQRRTWSRTGSNPLCTISRDEWVLLSFITHIASFVTAGKNTGRNENSSTALGQVASALREAEFGYGDLALWPLGIPPQMKV
jgi:hypothetical protein